MKLSTIKIPQYYGEPNNINNNTVQEKTYKMLCEWSGYPGFYATSADSQSLISDIKKINEEYTDFVDSISMSNDISVASVYSVVEYYFPDERIAQQSMKYNVARNVRDYYRMIAELKRFLESTLKERDTNNKSVDKSRERTKLPKSTLKSNTTNSNVKVNTSKLEEPKNKSNKSQYKSVKLSTDSSVSCDDMFPTFADEAFPSAESNIFESLLLNK